MDNCKQVNIPLSDNTPLDCPSFHKDKCIIIPEGSQFLLTNDNDTLEDYHTKLEDKLVAQNQRILTLEVTNPQIVDFDLNLAGTTLSLSVNSEVKATIDLTSLTSAGLTEVKEIISGTAGQTTITLANTPSNSVPNQVIVDGIYQTEGVANDYTITGDQLVFQTPLNLNDSVQVLYKY